PNATDKLALDGGDVGEGAIISLARRFRADVGGRNDVHLVPQVVEGQQAVIEGEDAIGQTEIVLGALGQALELSHHVVGEISDAAGGERRQLGQSCRLELPQTIAQQLDHTALAPFHRGAVANRQLFSSRSNYHARPGAEECVAADLLAALHRLQQERIILSSRDAQERAHRRQQIRAQRLRDGHQREVAAELQKTFVVRREHRELIRIREVYRGLYGRLRAYLPSGE